MQWRSLLICLHAHPTNHRSPLGCLGMSGGFYHSGRNRNEEKTAANHGSGNDSCYAVAQALCFVDLKSTATD